MLAMLYSECLNSKTDIFCYTCTSFNECIMKPILEHKISMQIDDAPEIIYLSIKEDFQRYNEVRYMNDILTTLDEHMRNPVFRESPIYVPTISEQRSIKCALDDMFEHPDFVSNTIDEYLQSTIYRIYTDITIGSSSFLFVKIWILIVNYIKQFWLFKHPEFISQIGGK